MEEAKKTKCYKRLIYKQLAQISGLCGPQFLRYLPKHFTHLCRALYGDAILMAAGNQQKHLEFTFSIKALPFHSRANIRAHKHIFSHLKWLNFQWDINFLFWCHALWKLGSSNCCIFEMKHASGLETCTKIYFLFIFNLG